MKQIYFITATNTDVGKTKASEVFLKKFTKEGKKVGYFKPIETGIKNIPADGTAMLNLTKKLNPDFKVKIGEESYNFPLFKNFSFPKLKKDRCKTINYCLSWSKKKCKGIL